MPRFEDYDMISDFIDWLGQSAQCKFVVKLAKKDKDGNREGFHKEYTYRSSYNNVELVSSIRRSFDYYLTIEGVTGNDIYIQIRPHNMIMLQNVLNQISGYLFDSSLWAIKNKILVIKGKPQPLVINHLPMDKWMTFEIIVIEYNGQFDKGVRIGFPNDQYTDVRIDQFMGFLYFINTFNMYQAACTLINYIQRPDFGTNMITIDNTYRSGNYNPNYEGEVYAKGNRTIEPQIPKPQKSFFTNNKIDKLSE